MNNFRNSLFIILAAVICPAAGVSINAQVIESYVTTADRTCLFSHNENAGEFSDCHNERRNYIIIDKNQRFQTMDGFGFALTGGSAQHIKNMSAEARKSLLTELFDPAKGIGINYIRLTLGASDLNDRVFSYDDMPIGEEDL